MVGATLDDIRRCIESLASDSGSYYLVCARTGERPVPATGLSFESRTTARAAARATEQYRGALRQYDPHVPYYDVIVCSRAADGTAVDGESSATAADLETRSPADHDPNRSVVDFCHTVAGAVFETIDDSSHAALEDTIMDTYFETAETIDDPDELCLRLLESTAVELEDSLEPAAQRDVLLAAAQRLPARPSGDDPLEATLSRLESVALLESYAIEPTVDLDTGTRSWAVTLEDYVLGRSADRAVTLPMVLELFRRFPSRDLAVAAASSPDSNWRIDVTTAPADGPSGLLSVSWGER
ncbi:DUF7551 domain-containing protein [Natronolimnohabitans innermongolicus]|uniref:Uncharacterized protein n=1 Tax=Natronolimnohabitans innermongolicus JCM 12255 TaxID=1227499 RepID=L9X1S2_9EURY|nr:hypothetical protein [Natronolimnohabitans innermongolicus]ELY54513.1 hypothetical protein C493_12469 [Natronolimnohabitans innermongolicus JCM 12255]